MKQQAMRISLVLLFCVFSFSGLVGFTILPDEVSAQSYVTISQGTPGALGFGLFKMDSPYFVYSGADWSIDSSGAQTNVQFAMSMWLMDIDKPGYLVLHYKPMAEAGSIQIQFDENQPEEAFHLTNGLNEPSYYWVSRQIPSGLHSVFLSSLEAKPVHIIAVEIITDLSMMQEYSQENPSITLPVPGAKSGYSGESEVPAIVAGEGHACYLTRNGGVKCWGNNLFSQVGRGSNSEPFINQPDYVMNLGASVKKIAAGDNHNCAILNDGSVKCWGKPSYGQLGVDNLGQTKRQPDPLPVKGLSGLAIDITAGGNHTCVLISNGIVQCWGDNSFGQLGFKSEIQYVFIAGHPVELPGEAGQIDAGGEHTCAILKTGNTLCWGNNEHGQLGNGTKNSSYLPVEVDGLTNAQKITAGRSFTCAITGDAVKCWGENTSGQLGNNSTTDSPIPVSVADLNPGVFSISAGGLHACSMSRTQKDKNEVHCWGDNRKGQLGNHTARDQFYLKPIRAFTELDGGVSISAGGEFTCSVYSDGSGSCWGDHSFGQGGSGLDGWRVFDLQDGICGDVWSGSIMNGGKPLEGVRILDGNGHETTTDANGEFCFLDVIPGSYTIKPVQEGATFAPLSENVTLKNGSPGYLHFEQNP